MRTLSLRFFTGSLFVLCVVGVIPMTASADTSVDIDAVVPGTCGNDKKEVGEQCDGSDLGDATCQSLGYAGGDLSCSSSCSYDVSDCESTQSQVTTAGGRGLTREDMLARQNITRAVIEGRGFANSRIRLLIDGEYIRSTRADKDGDFRMTTRDLTAGIHTFHFTASKDGMTAKTQSVTVRIEEGTVTRISGLVFPPAVNESVRHIPGKELRVSGLAYPHSDVTVRLSGNRDIVHRVTADDDGVWVVTVDPDGSGLRKNDTDSQSVSISAEVQIEGETYSSAVVRTQLPYTRSQDKEYLFGDINRDGRVDVVDFFIMQYWWNTARDQPPARVDLSGDGQITLQDFSILMSQWTG